MTVRASYDRPSIVRAFQHHQAHGGPDFAYMGIQNDRFRVRLQGEILDLTNREAWLVALALAAGRSIQPRVDQIAAQERAASLARSEAEA